jgi:DNA (cytosine-5)-methyltransferase 1
LEGIGYETGTLVFPASAIHAPHRRMRLFIIGRLADTHRKFNRDEWGRMDTTQREEEGEKWTAFWDAAQCSSATSRSRARGVGNSTGTSEEGFPLGTSQRQSVLGCGSGNGRGVGNPPDSQRPEEHDVTPWYGGTGWLAGSDAPPRASWQGDNQSRLGSISDGLPRGMARLDLPAMPTRFPAYRNQPQYEWEPPRVTVRDGKKHKGKKLHALGNAIVPAQAYEAMKIIAHMWEEDNRCTPTP